LSRFAKSDWASGRTPAEKAFFSIPCGLRWPQHRPGPGFSVPLPPFGAAPRPPSFLGGVLYDSTTPSPYRSLRAPRAGARFVRAGGKAKLRRRAVGAPRVPPAAPENPACPAWRRGPRPGGPQLCRSRVTTGVSWVRRADPTGPVRGVGPSVPSVSTEQGPPSVEPRRKRPTLVFALLVPKKLRKKPQPPP